MLIILVLEMKNGQSKISEVVRYHLKLDFESIQDYLCVYDQGL